MFHYVCYCFDDASHCLMPCCLCHPQYGMTPLMHAAYKGKADMCKLLLQHGADVNCNEHEHGYTALMFAGLSGTINVTDLLLSLLHWKASSCTCIESTSVPAGNTEITWMMLDAGAETDVVNSVGRTAAQMAAFVGMSGCSGLCVLPSYTRQRQQQWRS